MRWLRASRISGCFLWAQGGASSSKCVCPLSCKPLMRGTFGRSTRDPRRLILAAVISTGCHQRIHRSTASLPSLLEFPRDPDCFLQASSIQGPSQPLTPHAQFFKGLRPQPSFTEGEKKKKGLLADFSFLRFAHGGNTQEKGTQPLLGIKREHRASISHERNSK